jgi:hypothetical protein
MPHKKVPKVYAYVYVKLKEKNKGSIVRTSDLKGVIERYLCWNKKNPWGLPRSLVYDIIKDMEYWKLIIRIDQRKYEILRNPCERFIFN